MDSTDMSRVQVFYRFGLSIAFLNLIHALIYGSIDLFLSIGFEFKVNRCLSLALIDRNPSFGQSLSTEIRVRAIEWMKSSMKSNRGFNRLERDKSQALRLNYCYDSQWNSRNCWTFCVRVITGFDWDIDRHFRWTTGQCMPRLAVFSVIEWHFLVIYKMHFYHSIFERTVSFGQYFTATP